jgi:regulator of protease activity HflC (stomatin/prohibitin superfamily)
MTRQRIFHSNFKLFYSRRLVLLLLASVGSLTGCYKQMGSSEGAVLTNFLPLPVRWTRPIEWKYGIVSEAVGRGQFVLYVPGLQRIDAYDLSVKTIDVAAESDLADKDNLPGMRLKTAEGNNVYVSISVRYQLREDHLSTILRNFGPAPDIETKILIPTVRSLVRTVLGKLTTVEFSLPDLRRAAADETAAALNRRLSPLGIAVQKINVPKPRYNTQYEAKINEKETNNQEAEKILSQQGVARVEFERKAIEAEAGKSARIEKARGYFEVRKREADALKYEKMQKAKGIEAKLTADAAGWDRINRALASGGGKNLVAKAIAESMAGKKIVLIPTGNEQDLSVTNMNDLLKTLLLKNEVESLVTAPKSEAEKGEAKEAIKNDVPPTKSEPKDEPKVQESAEKTDSSKPKSVPISSEAKPGSPGSTKKE